MSSELIERLAREAGRWEVSADHRTPRTDHGSFVASVEWVRRFAALVAEECAKVADAEHKAPLQDQHWYCACAAIRDGIRAKFKEP